MGPAGGFGGHTVGGAWARTTSCGMGYDGGVGATGTLAA